MFLIKKYMSSVDPGFLVRLRLLFRKSEISTFHQRTLSENFSLNATSKMALFDRLLFKEQSL